ncbi:MAG: VOC family protein, partial [Thermomicrobiales bacterium]
MHLGGLHHVTAVTGQAARNVEFYTRVLGMRLVKKTVNQDDVSAYHLFYGDEVGNAGTEVTFFDWPNMTPNRPGTGSIAAIGLTVPDTEALAWWAESLTNAGVDHQGIEERGGRSVLAFADPEGQRLVLVADEATHDFSPWEASPVPADKQIRGLHHVLLVVEELAPTEQVLTDVLGFRRGENYPSLENPELSVTVFAMANGGAGAEVPVEERPQQAPARLGTGGVHHVAFRTPDDEEHRQWQERISSAGIGVTEVIDRFYFRSIYFREP